ncbi:Glycogen operon protein GlgX [Thalassocella blandensis]|nr:Glycogen operon protein GlgX [Thalassocella blandensis]
MFNWHKISEGDPYPLGATVTAKGINFALFSAHAERIELCIFDRFGLKEFKRFELSHCTDHVWHIHIEGLKPGTLYGYRVHGPWDPHAGHRFNHHKLLIDPYAKKLHGSFRWSDLAFGYDQSHKDQDLIMDTRDNAHIVPKSVALDDSDLEAVLREDSGRLYLPKSTSKSAASKQPAGKPKVPWNKTVIYETHVKGFTKLHMGVPMGERGTFAGMMRPEVVDYVKGLGVTAIELLPVHAFIDEHFLLNHELTNYWGYNTLSFFSAHAPYLSVGERAEFRRMVDAYHEAGIEVILDVVYNHTAEGNHLGPTLSFRGIDNASYYCLASHDARFYANDTGCGNTLNVKHPRVLQMVMDSLRYWANTMNVDGFRFDLATVLGREVHGFDPGSGFFDAVRQDPSLNACKFIAEPWDIGPGGYQLGNYPSGWSEWNDRFRDTVRQFWRGDEGMLPEFARRIHGSSDLFEHSGRAPYATINFVTSHDGFTLNDMVSYKNRNNFANKENNNDGHHSNFSDNHGEEGETHNSKVLELRARQKRNFIATLFLSQGTPMLLAGDECGRTQGGNNNAYCQDNDINWLDWKKISGENRCLQDFTQYVTGLRQEYPILTSLSYIHRPDEPEDKDDCRVMWVNELGEEMQEGQWKELQRHTLGWVLENNIFDRKKIKKTLLLVLFNASSEKREFTLMDTNKIKRWDCLLDTCESDGVPAKKVLEKKSQITLLAKSMQLLSAVF